MFKKCLWAGICIWALSIGSVVNATDMEAILDDSTSTTGFSVKDSNENTLMRVQGDGKVGIGTTAPNDRLDIGGGNIVMGYEIINEDCPAAGTGCRASCSPGKQVIGGGCNSSSQNAIIRSRPSDDGTEWRCDDNPDGALTAYAICANIK